MKMNLKGWKKVSEAKSHTVLKNSHGHELKIVHKSLSKQNQAALKSLPHFYAGGYLTDPSSLVELPAKADNVASADSLPSGSDVDNTPDAEEAAAIGQRETAANPPSPLPAITHSDESEDVSPPKGGSESGRISYDDGGQVQPPQPKPTTTPKPNPIGYPDGASMNKGGKVKRYVHGGEVSSDDSDDSSEDSSSDAKPQAPVVINVGQQSGQSGQSGQPGSQPAQGINKASQDLQAMGQPGNAAAAAPPPNTAGDQMNQNSQDDQPLAQAPQAPQVPDPASLAQQASGAEGDIGAATAAQETAKGNAAHAGATSMQTLQDTFNKNYGDRLAEIQKLGKEITSGKIDYNRYIGDMSTGKRISSTIGLILGGIGSGLAGGSNPALDILNGAIDRDVQQQKAQLGAKQTLYSENLKILGDQREAYQTTAMQMHYKTDLDMQAAAAKSGNPLAIANAKKAQVDAMMKFQPMLQQQAMRQTMMQASQGGDPSSVLPMLRMLNPEAAKGIEDHMLPGIKGQTSIAPPSDARDDITAKKNLIDGVDKLRGMVDQNNLKGMTDVDKRSYLASRGQELQQLYDKAVGASKSEGEQQALKNIFGPNPSAIFAKDTYAPKLKGLSDAMKEQLGGKYAQFGVSPEQIQPQYRADKGSYEPGAASAAPLSPSDQNMVKFAQNILKTSKNPAAIDSANKILKLHKIQ